MHHRGSCLVTSSGRPKWSGRVAPCCADADYRLGPLVAARERLLHRVWLWVLPHWRQHGSRQLGLGSHRQCPDQRALRQLRSGLVSQAANEPCAAGKGQQFPNRYSIHVRRPLTCGFRFRSWVLIASANQLLRSLAEDQQVACKSSSRRTVFDRLRSDQWACPGRGSNGSALTCGPSRATSCRTSSPFTTSPWVTRSAGPRY